MSVEQQIKALIEMFQEKEAWAAETVWDKSGAIADSLYEDLGLAPLELIRDWAITSGEGDLSQVAHLWQDVTPDSLGQPDPRFRLRKMADEIHKTLMKDASAGDLLLGIRLLVCHLEAEQRCAERAGEFEPQDVLRFFAKLVTDSQQIIEILERAVSPEIPQVELTDRQERILRGLAKLRRGNKMTRETMAGVAGVDSRKTIQPDVKRLKSLGFMEGRHGAEITPAGRDYLNRLKK